MAHCQPHHRMNTLSPGIPLYVNAKRVSVVEDIATRLQSGDRKPFIKDHCIYLVNTYFQMSIFAVDALSCSPPSARKVHRSSSDFF